MSCTLVDTHVHFHEMFKLTDFVRAARDHGRSAGAEGPICLLMAQISPDAALRSLWDQVRSLAEDWKTEEAGPGAMVFEQNGKPVVVAVAGRQLTSKEGLEVLALASNAELANHRPLEETISRIQDAGGVPAVPWGFGKWWFRRGRVLGEFMNRGLRSFLLGDSGCRPTAMGMPRSLKIAMQCSIPIIAGSDPLPLPGQVHRVGSFGNVLPGQVDLHNSQAWLADSLRGLATSPPTFGSQRGTAGFLSDQLQMRL